MHDGRRTTERSSIQFKRQCLGNRLYPPFAIPDLDLRIAQEAGKGLKPVFIRIRVRNGDAKTRSIFYITPWCVKNEGPVS